MLKLTVNELGQKVKKIVQPPDVQQSLGGHQQAGSFVGIEAVELPRAVGQ